MSDITNTQEELFIVDCSLDMVALDKSGRFRKDDRLEYPDLKNYLNMDLDDLGVPFFPCSYKLTAAYVDSRENDTVHLHLWGELRCLKSPQTPDQDKISQIIQKLSNSILNSKAFQKLNNPLQVISVSFSQDCEVLEKEI